MRRLLLLAALSITAVGVWRMYFAPLPPVHVQSGSGTIVWKKYTKPSTCNSGDGCYWPTGQGFATAIPDPVNGKAFIYTTRQPFTGTARVTGGGTAGATFSVQWIRGDPFNPRYWGKYTPLTGTYVASTVKFIVGPSPQTYNIVANSVTSTTMQATAGAAITDGLYTFVVGGAGGNQTVSTDVYEWSPITHTFDIWPGGNGTIQNAEAFLQTDDPSVGWPADRQQAATESYDPNRHVIWLTGGINQNRTLNCRDTSNTNCNNAAYPPTNPGYTFVTTWKANLATKTWTGITTAHAPYNNQDTQGSAFDWDHNILYQVGDLVSGVLETAIYCPTDLNSVPGTLTPNQSSAGCVADDWHRLTGATLGTPPPINYMWPMVVYMHANGKFLVFSKALTDGTLQPKPYIYNPLNQTYAQSSCTFPVAFFSNNNQPGLTALPNGKIFYHYFPASNGTQSDWLYDPASDTCSQMTSIGGGPSGSDLSTETMVSYDSATNTIIAWPQGQNGAGTIWEGQLDPTSLSIPVTYREALPIGLSNCTTAASCGVTRNGDVVRVGIPLPDNSAGGTSTTSNLGLTGCSAGQFRSLGTWPSGRIKHLEILMIPNGTLSAGGTGSCTLTTGSGNFGGAGNIATDNGTTISINTGVATYTIKKANYNLIDSGSANSTQIYATTTSPNRGMVLMGPVYPATTCASGCTTQYSSANDGSSNVIIEENGPVEAVLKATFALKDASGNTYLRGTVRSHFQYGHQGIRFWESLQNADDNAGGTFATAFKAYDSYYGQLDSVSLGTMSYRFGGRAGTVGPTAFSGTETADVTQLYSNWMEDRNGDPGVWDTSALPQNSPATIIPRAAGGGCSDLYCYPGSGTGSRVDEGYSITDGATVLESGTRSQIPQGWADSSNSSGVGVLAGISYMSAFWPKSVELQNGGNTLAIGLMPSASANITSTVSGMAWWICYACYQINEFYIEPHDTAPSSYANDFFRYQYDLIASIPVANYNAANAGLWGSLPDPTAENNYYQGMSSTYVGTGTPPSPAVSATTLCCDVDHPANTGTGPYIIRAWGFNATGGVNESDTSHSYLWNFDVRGFTAKYIWGKLREHWIEESVLPRSDFGGWRTKTYGSPLSAMGFPTLVTSANNTMAIQGWGNQQGPTPVNSDSGLHAHFYGMPDWYFQTGLEHYADSVRQGYYDYAINKNVPMGGCTPTTSPSCASSMGYPSVPRAAGIKGLFSVYADLFASATGDTTSAAAARATAEALLAKLLGNTTWKATMVTPKTSCTNGSCTGSGDYGIDPNRGVMQAMQTQQPWFVPLSASANETVDGTRTSFTFTMPVPTYTPAAVIMCGQSSTYFPSLVVTVGSTSSPSVIATDQATTNLVCPANTSLTLCDRNASSACVNSKVVSGSAPVGANNYYSGTASITFATAPTVGTPVAIRYWVSSPPALCDGGVPACTRISSGFQDAIFSQFLLYYAQDRGRADPEWDPLTDLAYGVSYNFLKGEMTVNSDSAPVGGINWQNNGQYFGLALDTCNDPRAPFQSGQLKPTGNGAFTPPLPTPSCWAVGAHQMAWSNDPTLLTPFAPLQTVWWQYMVRNDLFGETQWQADWQSVFYRTMSSGGGPLNVTEYGRPDVSALVYRALNPAPLLNDIPITSFTDLGSGYYTVGWTVPTNMVIPAGAVNPYRFKWGTRAIKMSLGFDMMETNTFQFSPTSYQTWFSASDVSDEPTPFAAGSTQYYTFNTGTTGLTSQDFSLKVYQSTAAPPVSTGGSAIGGRVNMGGKIIFH